MRASLIVNIQVDPRGALEDSRIGIIRRTVALWLIAVAQWLLKSRIDFKITP